MDSLPEWCAIDFVKKFKRNVFARLKENYDPILFCNTLDYLGDKLIGYHEIDGREYLEIHRKDLSRSDIYNKIESISDTYFKQNPKVIDDEGSGNGTDIIDVLSYSLYNFGVKIQYDDGTCYLKYRYVDLDKSTRYLADDAVDITHVTPDFFDSIAFLDLYCLSLYGFFDDVDISIKERSIYPKIWNYLKETLKSLYTEGKLKI